MDLPDSELLQRHVTDGDQAAFATIVRRHLDLVYGAAFRQTGDPGAAQEVTQTVFLALAKRAGGLASHPSLAGWLYKTALFQAKQDGRAKTRRLAREQTAANLGSTLPSEDSALAALLPFLDETLRELKPAEREVLVLRYLREKSIEQTGAALGLSESAAQKRVAKALDCLAKAFERRGFRTAALSGLQKTAAAAFPLKPFTGALAKLMTLTKVQTAAFCVVITMVPITYEWQSRRQLQNENLHLSAQIAALDNQIAARQREAKRFESAGRQSPSAASAADPPLEDDWNESSPFLRLPRSLLSHVQFTAFGVRKGQDGKPERYPMLPIAPDGTLQPALEAALGLSSVEKAQAGQVCRAVFSEFHALAKRHGHITQKPWPDSDPSGISIMLKTEAFPEEGAALKESFRARLAPILGEERTAALFEQAAPSFLGVMNEFGAKPRQFEILRQEDGTLSYFENYRSSSHISPLGQINPQLIPAALQPTAAAWTLQANSSQPRQ